MDGTLSVMSQDGSDGYARQFWAQTTVSFQPQVWRRVAAAHSTHSNQSPGIAGLVAGAMSMSAGECIRPLESDTGQLVGDVAARAGGARVMAGAMRVVFWGALAMALTAGAGALFETGA